MTRDPDELYALPRDEFTAARKALAKSVRDAGDPRAAAQIDKLAKPTTAAWLANRLARDEPDAVADLTDLGAALREAHQSADGAALRDLTRRRTEVLRDLVRRAGRDEPLSESITRELEEMFTTALLDESAGERLKTGRIASVRDLSGAPAWPGLEVTRKPAPAKAAKKPAAVDRKAAIAEAKAAVKAAESERTKADRAVADAEKVVVKAEDRVREINEQLDAAEAAELEARRSLQLARRSAKEAERAATAAWRRRQQLEQ